MKKYIIATLLVAICFFTATPALAQTAQTQTQSIAQLNQQLITLLIQMISQLQAQILVLQQQRAAELSTAGWQTYRNDQYGFEFKYPAGFRLAVSGGEVFPSQSNFVVSITKEVTGSPSFSLAVNSPAGPDLGDKFYNLRKNPDGTVYILETVIPDLGRGDPDDPTNRRTIIKAFLPMAGGVNYNWVALYTNDGNNYETLFKQVLSTFKFTSTSTVSTPLITAISPTAGVPGSEITIWGTNFKPTSTVFFGNCDNCDASETKTPTFVSSDGTSLKVLAPTWSVTPNTTIRVKVKNNDTAVSNYTQFTWR